MWGNLMLAVLEDLPMLCLTFAYIKAVESLGQTPALITMVGNVHGSMSTCTET